MKRFYRSLPAVVALTIATVMSSCVSTKNVALSANDRQAMKGKTVIVTQRGMPSYGVLTPGTMLVSSLTGGIGGAIAGTVAENKGKEMLAKHRISVPEETIVRSLSKTLAKRTGARVATARLFTKEFKSAKIAPLAGNADYVLDVYTSGWLGLYYPAKLNKYYIMYCAKMQLIETKSGRVVAEGFQCYQGKDAKNAPNYEGIYANDAAFLRSEMQKGTSAAEYTFAQQL